MTQTLSSSEIRQTFLDFFEENQHTVVASSSLIPSNDPTLLFTNAGMVQFKDVFFRLRKTPLCPGYHLSKMYARGPANITIWDNVGPSPRHHTFFEMLGNFSLGNYI